jgi:hypothetical protein
MYFFTYFSGRKRKRTHQTSTAVVDHLQPSSETRADETMQSNTHTLVAGQSLVEEDEVVDYGHGWEDDDNNDYW